MIESLHTLGLVTYKMLTIFPVTSLAGPKYNEIYKNSHVLYDKFLSFINEKSGGPWCGEIFEKSKNFIVY